MLGYGFVFFVFLYFFGWWVAWMSLGLSCAVFRTFWDDLKGFPGRLLCGGGLLGFFQGMILRDDS